jgi:hypothetical protein
VGNYGTTSAFSLYGDIGGTVDITSHVKVTEIGVAARYHPLATNWISPMVHIQTGVAAVSFDLTQRLVDLNSRTTSESIVDVSGILWQGSGSAGVVFAMEQFFLAPHVGFRIAKGDSLDGTSTLNGRTLSNGTFPLTVDVGGFEFGIEVGVRF